MKSMLRIAAGLALSACFVMFAGCQSLPTIQQQFDALCPTVNTDLAILAVSPQLNASQQAVAAHAHDLNVKICAAGAAINMADLKDLAETSLPALVTVIAAIPPTPQFPSTAIALALGTFGPLALQLGEQVVSTVHGTPAAAPAPVSTPAPTSASPIAAGPM
jgi:hypothetical protein